MAAVDPGRRIEWSRNPQYTINLIGASTILPPEEFDLLWSSGISLNSIDKRTRLQGLQKVTERVFQSEDRASESSHEKSVDRRIKDLVLAYQRGLGDIRSGFRPFSFTQRFNCWTEMDRMFQSRGKDCETRALQDGAQARAHVQALSTRRAAQLEEESDDVVIYEASYTRRTGDRGRNNLTRPPPSNLPRRRSASPTARQRGQPVNVAPPSAPVIVEPGNQDRRVRFDVQAPVLPRFIRDAQDPLYDVGDDAHQMPVPSPLPPPPAPARPPALPARPPPVPALASPRADLNPLHVPSSPSQPTSCYKCEIAMGPGTGIDAEKHLRQCLDGDSGATLLECPICDENLERLCDAKARERHIDLCCTRVAGGSGTSTSTSTSTSRAPTSRTTTTTIGSSSTPAASTRPNDLDASRSKNSLSLNSPSTARRLKRESLNFVADSKTIPRDSTTFEPLECQVCFEDFEENYILPHSRLGQAMLVVGLTGGIASGKSTVSSLIKSHNVPLIDLDILAREAVEPHSRALKQITQHFGKDIINQQDGTLNREKLGQIVFNDERQRKKLNSIVHPAVRRLLAWQLIKYWLRGERMAVVDAPLLIEAGLWRFCGAIVVVYCSENLQLQRLQSRNNLSPSDARSRISAQSPLSSKLIYADHVIDNSGSRQDLDNQVSTIVTKLHKKAGWSWIVCWLLPPVGMIVGLFRVAYRLYIVSVGQQRRKGRGTRGERRVEEIEMRDRRGVK
ncbi:Dephospho-CoA kinase cab5 [Microbotryomycetes sp. JL221]|nr:Dephospho-CoA kinase cab5 [Microbotryomycetes sp. JL221]